jgi:hypothetical protein
MSSKKGLFERARLRLGRAILGEHYQALVDKYRRYKNKYRAAADRLEGIELRFNLLLADLRKEEDPLIQLIYQHGRGLKTIRVDEPLVLISQIQRSGGTLLNQFFDGHPQVVAPHNSVV